METIGYGISHKDTKHMKQQQNKKQQDETTDK
jgi:hypothetical protein